jgi:hypothetical protein
MRRGLFCSKSVDGAQRWMIEMGWVATSTLTCQPARLGRNEGALPHKEEA